MVKEILRIDSFEIVKSLFANLEGMLVGRGVLDNPNIIREDDITNGDVVFYLKDNEGERTK